MLARPAKPGPSFVRNERLEKKLIWKALVVLALTAVSWPYSAQSQPAGVASENFVLLTPNSPRRGWQLSYDGLEAMARLRFDRVEEAISGQSIAVREGNRMGYMHVLCTPSTHVIMISAEPIGGPYPTPETQIATVMGVPGVRVKVSGHRYSIDQTLIDRSTFLELLEAMHGARFFEIRFSSDERFTVSALMPDGYEVLLDGGDRTTRDAMRWLHQRCP